jgi:hypothetical protein
MALIGIPTSFEREEGGEERAEYDEPGHERRPVADRTCRLAQRRGVIGRGDVAPIVPEQHRQRACHRHDVDRHHHGGVAREGDAEVVGGDDVDEVRDHQRDRGGVAHEPGAHHEGEDRRRREAERVEDRDHDRGQDQRCAVIGEER